jgi:enoyl-CoA hydratase/carnithine racemase
MDNFEFAVTRGGPVASIDLSRPEEGNALTRPMMVQLAGIIRDLGASEETRVIVLKARGSEFCRGRDTRGENYQGLSPNDIRIKAMGAVLGVYDAIQAAPIPVVACVQGPAIGFGAALAGASDITLASDAARFSFTEIKHGIPPTMAMAAVLRNVPAKALTYLIYSAQELSAQEAVSFGLASRVYPHASFEKETDAFVSELAGRPRLVIETIKKFQQHATGLPAPMVSEYAGTLLALVRS